MGKKLFIHWVAVLHTVQMGCIVNANGSDGRWVCWCWAVLWILLITLVKQQQHADKRPQKYLSVIQTETIVQYIITVPIKQTIYVRNQLFIWFSSSWF